VPEGALVLAFYRRYSHHAILNSRYLQYRMAPRLQNIFVFAMIVIPMMIATENEVS
jgi:hypothetical protein